MNKDIIKDSIKCLSNAKLNDTTYEIARDIVIEQLNKQKEVLNRLKVVYTSMQFSAPENMYIFIEQMGDLLEEIE